MDNRLMLSETELNQALSKDQKTGDLILYHQRKANESLRKYFYHVSAMNAQLNKNDPTRYLGDWKTMDIQGYVGPEQMIIQWNAASVYNYKTFRYKQKYDFLYHEKEIKPLINCQVSSWSARPQVTKMMHKVDGGKDYIVNKAFEKEDLVKTDTGFFNSFE